MILYCKPFPKSRWWGKLIRTAGIPEWDNNGMRVIPNWPVTASMDEAAYSKAIRSTINRCCVPPLAPHVMLRATLCSPCDAACHPLLPMWCCVPPSASHVMLRATICSPCHAACHPLLPMWCCVPQSAPHVPYYTNIVTSEWKKLIGCLFLGHCPTNQNR